LSKNITELGIILKKRQLVKYFDSRDNVRCGWLDKHFKDGNIPDKTILK